jgi:hypothetical protein
VVLLLRSVFVVKTSYPKGILTATAISRKVSGKMVTFTGHQISDGVIEQVGFESRTFRIEKAKTIDLVLEKDSDLATGSYTISVLL